MRHTLLIMCVGVGLSACEDSSTPSIQGETMPAHLLTASEYNTTVQDLLGTPSRPADFFPAVSASEFDANVGVLSTLSSVQREALFNAASDVVEEAFKSPELTSRLVTCMPASDTDTTCARTLVTSLGRRAFRRSLDAEEVDAYLNTYRSARTTLEMGHVEAVAHVLRVMLSSPSFFLRIERPGKGKEPIEPAALASRLSYLLWGSMPDDTLLDAAERGELDDDAALRAMTDRMLDDPRGQRFVSRFLGQWLGTVRLSSHNVDPTRFRQWTPTVATAVEGQANTFLSGFVTGTTPWSELFSAPHPASAAVQPLLAADPSTLKRRGFLTLPAYLTLSSHSDRTSPTSRAKGVITSLFCTDMTPPPGVVTELPANEGGTSPKTVRERLEAHRRNPACSGCHNMLDPIGLSLENFDAVGRYRTQDEGQPIDASGTYQGTSFTEVSGLMPLLAADPRLGTCAPHKLFSFAMRRSLDEADYLRAEKLAETWKAGTFRELLHEIVVSPAFRGHTEEAP
ncbi:DUF1588 domain-containing protein [Archangium lansingense]|uniref:DUF1588 domain-containing protein n=1 Tax=Archangium lansingense TaxID=2995310 RepID=A0ABT4AG94_9BACT|nr:DUF1592 domain-containing protein [Archangium lansinium]MCY1080701.1 DUF1588 domain-containing protein [Archangium lansinium]